MINIYTVDPNSLNSMDNLSEIIEHFGIEKFRLIWKFPIHWNTLIKEVFRTNFKNRERIRAYSKLEKIRKYIIEIPPKLVDNESDINLITWFPKADELYHRKKYTGIISNKNPETKGYIGKINELDNWLIFNNQDSYRLKRIDVEMAKAISPLLYSSNEIHFVDRYFHFLKDHHIRPLKEFIKKIFNDLRESDITTICYHTGDSVLTDNIETTLQRELKNLIPKGITFKVIRWTDNKLHNRFILTNIGGIIFQHGLSDWGNGNSIEFDDITPLPADACRAKNADGCKPFMEYYLNNEYSEIIEF